VTADGKLKACLFGQEEVSLLDSLREGLGVSLEVIEAITPY